MSADFITVYLVKLRMKTSRVLGKFVLLQLLLDLIAFYSGLGVTQRWQVAEFLMSFSSWNIAFLCLSVSHITCHICC